MHSSTIFDLHAICMRFHCICILCISRMLQICHSMFCAPSYKRHRQHQRQTKYLPCHHGKCCAQCSHALAGKTFKYPASYTNLLPGPAERTLVQRKTASASSAGCVRISYCASIVSAVGRRPVAGRHIQPPAQNSTQTYTAQPRTSLYLPRDLATEKCI